MWGVENAHFLVNETNEFITEVLQNDVGPIDKLNQANPKQLDGVISQQDAEKLA